MVREYPPPAEVYGGVYESISCLGAGAMGEVYLAKDRRLGRLFTVKVLKADFDSRDARRRFKQESHFLLRLQHANIVRIVDVNEDDGRPYIVMDFVRGETLGEKLERREETPLRKKIEWMIQLCEGLSYAHDENIVHRDIKPGNLIIDANDGLLKILDWGIARSIDATAAGAAPRLTMVATQIGTLGYMPPEQMDAPDLVDHRADIFAAGAVLYELLWRRPAFPGDDFEVSRKVRGSDPSPLNDVVRGIPEGLAQIASRALEKDPGRRYQSAREFQDELKVQLHRLGEPPREPAGDPTVVPRLPRSSEALLSLATELNAKGARHYARRTVLEACHLDPSDRAINLLRQLESSPEFADLPPTRIRPPSGKGDEHPPYPPPQPPPRGTWSEHFRRYWPVAAVAGVLLGGFVWMVLRFLAPAGVDLTIEARPGGTVTSAVGRLNCRDAGDSRCTISVPVGTDVQLDWKEDDGFSFKGFSGPGCGARGRIRVTKSMKCVAEFDAILRPDDGTKTKYVLTVERPTRGMIVGEGIRCGSQDSDCEESFTQGKWLRLEVTSDDKGQEGTFTGDCVPDGRVQMTRSRTCGAVFGQGVQPPPPCIPPNCPPPPPPCPNCPTLTLTKADIEAIKSTLRRYFDAYGRLDADAVHAVQPSRSVKDIRGEFRQLTSVALSWLGDEKSVPKVDGSSLKGVATAIGKVKRTDVMKVPLGGSRTLDATFTMKRGGPQSDEWTIEAANFKNAVQ